MIVVLLLNHWHHLPVGRVLLPWTLWPHTLWWQKKVVTQVFRNQDQSTLEIHGLKCGYALLWYASRDILIREAVEYQKLYHKEKGSSEVSHLLALCAEITLNETSALIHVIKTFAWHSTHHIQSMFYNDKSSVSAVEAIAGHVTYIMLWSTSCFCVTSARSHCCQVYDGRSQSFSCRRPRQLAFRRFLLRSMQQARMCTNLISYSMVHVWHGVMPPNVRTGNSGR